MSGSTRTVLLPAPVQVVLRQNRRAVWTAGALVALAALVTVGARGWRGNTPPAPSGPDSASFERANAFLMELADHGSIVLLLVPFAVGMFVAGPLVARELETGTYKTAWTQSVSPARWLTARLAPPLVGAVAATVVLGVLYRVLREPFAGGGHDRFPWYDPTVFVPLGPALVGYAVLSIALGALAGLLVRRTALAMGAAGLATGAVMLAVSSVRGYLWPAVTRLGPADIGVDLSVDAHAMEIGAGWQTASGERLDAETCFRAIEKSPQQTTFQDCMTGRGATQRYVDFHPESHFWVLQVVETGILVVLAAGAVWVSFRVLRRMHG
ncbi:ABC transporter permease [Streptomyces sp. NPDC021093]|uniref:ABC transporter permease n=1 Tax=Streptomyces sp. NPDC021093 TaxID=3365112 RepID=UPI0037A666A6